MRPPTMYHGSKGRLAPWIVSLLPPHRTYIEPFAGSAAVLFAKPPSPTEIISDRDGNLVAFFRILHARPDDLIRALTLTPYARAEFTAADLDEPGLDDLERARRWFIRVNQSVGKVTRGSTGWAVARNTNGLDHARKFAALTDRLAACADRLRRVHIDNRAVIEVITRHAGPDATIYCDPPYLASVRTSATKRAGDYAIEYDRPEDYRALAEALHATPAAVLLSGYPSELYDELYDELYASWPRVQVTVDRPSSWSSGGRSARATEVIWSNRPLSAQLTIPTSAFIETARIDIEEAAGRSAAETLR